MQTPTSMIITSVADVLAFAISASNRFSHVVWYRGHANADSTWRLLPSSFRRFPSAENEQAAVLNFRRRAPSRHPSTPPQGDCAAWLCLMQHYGLPTRLLDWTESILIAAFFAASDLTQKTDGAIFALAPMTLNSSVRLPYVPMLSNPELLNRILPAFGGTEKEQDIVAAIMPDVDQRMFIQQGVFTLHSTRTPLEKHVEQSSFLLKAIIPAAAKERIEWELRICGVSRSKLFPDLANLAMELIDQQDRSIKRREA
jgi:hypothetical protein